MELLTVLLASFAIAGKFVTFNVIDEAGKKQSLKFARGKYSHRDLNAYINKNIDIEFEWGNEGNRKLLSISFPSPAIKL